MVLMTRFPQSQERGRKKMHKKDGVFIIKIGSPEGRPKEEYADGKDSDQKKYTKTEFGGYSPTSLVSKLEDIKDAIANQNTRQALSQINSCIIRITKRELPEEKDDDPFTQSNFQLDQMLPSPGKS